MNENSSMYIRQYVLHEFRETIYLIAFSLNVTMPLMTTASIETTSSLDCAGSTTAANPKLSKQHFSPTK